MFFKKKKNKKTHKTKLPAFDKQGGDNKTTIKEPSLDNGCLVEDLDVIGNKSDHRSEENEKKREGLFSRLMKKEKSKKSKTMDSRNDYDGAKNIKLSGGSSDKDSFENSDLNVKVKYSKGIDKKVESDNDEVDHEILFDGITKEFRDGTVALDSVSMSIQAGEFVFLVGPSGAGKTTMMNLIVKDEIPTDGYVYVQGEDVGKIKNRKIHNLRRKIGYIYQDFKLLNSRTIFENVAISLEVVGKKPMEVHDTVHELLDLVGLEEKVYNFPKSLSGGEMQRLAIARALAHKPEVLLADEPTGNLDSASSWRVVELISKINDWGATIIFGTHDAEIVNTLKKRVIHLDKGKLVRDVQKGKYE